MPHLVPKQIIELPYVDRIPDPSQRPDQRRIEWIKNGDCLGAAEHAADNSGELNRGPVQVQKNAVTLMDNDKVIAESLSEIITLVNSHDDALGSIGDDNLAAKLERLEDTVTPLDAKIVENTQSIFLLSELAKATRDKVGNKKVLDINDRNVFADLFWIKKEIGNWAKKDVNDNDNDAIPEPTGLKARIISQGLSISSNERRIKALEADWVQSDVGALTSAVTDIRSELGRTVDAPVGGVYPWIVAAGLKHVAIDTEIASLKEIVGGGGAGDTLDERITKNTANITLNRQNINTNITQINALKSQVGDGTQPMSIVYKVNQNEIAVSTLKRVVGETEDAGLQKKVGDIVNEMGTDITANSIKGRLSANELDIRESKRDIATINTKLGNNTVGQETGIYRRIMNLESDLDSAGTGIKVRLGAVETEVKTKIGDAVMDGKKYIRTNKTWEELDSVGDVPEATPTKPMVRVRGKWEALVDHLPIRASGGYHVIGNETKTTLVKDIPADIVLDGSKVSALALSTNGIEEENGKLMFAAKLKGSTVNVVVEFRIESDDEDDAVVEILNKAGQIIFTRNVLVHEWTPTKKTILRMQCPVILAESDVISMRITNKTKASTITITDGIFYAFTI